MAARVVYTFRSIGPGITASLFIHGYSDRQAVNYSMVLYNQPGPGVLFPQAHATLIQGETFRWIVDGSIGRKVYVQNHDPFSSVGVDILEIVESF